MKKYHTEYITIELSKSMNKKAYFFVGDIKNMSKEDFDEEVNFVAKEIMSCIESEEMNEHPMEEISEKEAKDFSTELSIDTGLMGGSIKFHFIDFKKLWIEDTDKEQIEDVVSVSQEDVVKCLTELHEYYN